ncbi:Abcc3, partial [Symbiodinium pilosum]
VTVIFGVLCGQGLQSVAAAWLSFWSDHSHPDSVPHVTDTLGLVGYGGLSITAFVGIFSTSAVFRLTALKAARAFHRKLLANMLRLPMSFFDTTPLGRVLNRFSKDIYIIDEVLTQNLYAYLQVLSVVVCTIIVISVATPWFLVIIFPLLFLYRATQNFYIPAS